MQVTALPMLLERGLLFFKFVALLFLLYSKPVIFPVLDNSGYLSGD